MCWCSIFGNQLDSRGLFRILTTICVADQRPLPQCVWTATPLGPNPDFAPEAFVSPLDGAPPTIHLPPYIKPLPSKLTALDVTFLYKKGALIIPGASLQIALLKAYVEFVHPYMPLLPLHDVLGILGGQEQGSGAKISLLLYQAVMFVSVAFVDEKYLLDENYQNRKTARKAFFQRARVSSPPSHSSPAKPC